MVSRPLKVWKELPSGDVCVMDFADAKRFESHRLYMMAGNPQRRYVMLWHPDRRIEYLHRAIMSAPLGVSVDHINGDTLDNRKSNLRLATSSENGANVPKREGTSSRFKGVCWDKNGHRWKAHIGYQGKRVHLGYFVDEEEAARAYDRVARTLFGEFARTNFGENHLPKPRKLSHRRIETFIKEMVKDAPPLTERQKRIIRQTVGSVK